MRQYVAKMEILYFVQRSQRENNPTKSTLPRDEPFFLCVTLRPRRLRIYPQIYKNVPVSNSLFVQFTLNQDNTCRSHLIIPM